jgi:hypothetical protein
MDFNRINNIEKWYVSNGILPETGKGKGSFVSSPFPS